MAVLSTSTGPRLPAGLWVAAVAGLVHAGSSAYWAAGGTWLLDTLGTAIVTTS